MIPSVIGILVTLTGVYLVYIGIHGGPGETLKVYPKGKFDETYTGQGNANVQ